MNAHAWIAMNRLRQARDTRSWWNKVFGNDMPAFTGFLRPCEALAGSDYYRPGCAVRMKIQKRAAGWWAIPSEEEWNAEPVANLPWSDVQAWEVDHALMRDCFRQALHLTPVPGDEDEDAQVQLLGRCPKSHMLVHLCWADQTDNAFRALVYLRSAADGGCVLFPARTEAIAAILQGRGINCLALSECLDFADGVWKADCDKCCPVPQRTTLPNQAPDTENALIPQLLRKVDEIPLRTAALIKCAPRGRYGTLGTVQEPDFTATANFTNLEWQGRSYVLRQRAAVIIETLYIAQKSYGLSGMHQEELFSQVFSSDKKRWPSSNARIQNFFRHGDAKRLWDDGFIDHDGKGNFHLTPKIHTKTHS